MLDARRSILDPPTHPKTRRHQGHQEFTKRTSVLCPGINGRDPGARSKKIASTGRPGEAGFPGRHSHPSERNGGGVQSTRRRFFPRAGGWSGRAQGSRALGEQPIPAGSARCHFLHCWSPPDDVRPPSRPTMRKVAPDTRWRNRAVVNLSTPEACSEKRHGDAITDRGRRASIRARRRRRARRRERCGFRRVRGSRRSSPVGARCRGSREFRPRPRFRRPRR